ncbi:MAG: helix-turn-helix transcriptional regulator [Betaproteobacteria bacterium]|nr:helix-turn-helix transcriptional regulator [Betaproteobacteria bacterium]
MQQHPFKSADLAGRLRAARRAAGITQQQAAARIKAARTTIVAIEQGLRPIALGELQQLARFYAAPTAALLGKQAVFVDFDPNFGRSVNRADRNVRKTCRIMSRLIGGAAELENILVPQRSRPAWPRQRRLKSGNEQADAERDASRLRQDLALADAPIADLPHIIEMQLGIRIFLYPLDDKTAGMYCFDNRFGASILLNSKLTAPAAAVAAARQVGHFMVARKKGCLL